jgi:hypothetical protein
MCLYVAQSIGQLIAQIICWLSEEWMFNLLTPVIKSLRATLPAEIFLLGILIFKGLPSQRLM